MESQECLEVYKRIALGAVAQATKTYAPKNLRLNTDETSRRSVYRRVMTEMFNSALDAKLDEEDKAHLKTSHKYQSGFDFSGQTNKIKITARYMLDTDFMPIVDQHISKTQLESFRNHLFFEYLPILAYSEDPDLRSLLIGIRNMSRESLRIIVDTSRKFPIMAQRFSVEDIVAYYGSLAIVLNSLSATSLEKIDNVLSRIKMDLSVLTDVLNSEDLSAVSGYKIADGSNINDYSPGSIIAYAKQDGDTYIVNSRILDTGGHVASSEIGTSSYMVRSANIESGLYSELSIFGMLNNYVEISKSGNLNSYLNGEESREHRFWMDDTVNFENWVFNSYDFMRKHTGFFKIGHEGHGSVDAALKAYSSNYNRMFLHIIAKTTYDACINFIREANRNQEITNVFLPSMGLSSKYYVLPSNNLFPCETYDLIVKENELPDTIITLSYSDMLRPEKIIEEIESKSSGIATAVSMYKV